MLRRLAKNYIPDLAQSMLNYILFKLISTGKRVTNVDLVATEDEAFLQTILLEICKTTASSNPNRYNKCNIFFISNIFLARECT
jgi:hypothetical protein